jgi:uncharacterized membrane protein
MMTKQEWYLKRNCSLTPRQVGIAFAVQCLVSFSIALICTLHGAWQVFIFSALEMLALGTALLVYGRHATDHEHIALTDGCLLIERINAGKIEQVQLDPNWTRVAPPKRYQDLIRLESQGKRIEVGRFITNDKRKQLASELQSQLQHAAYI